MSRIEEVLLCLRMMQRSRIHFMGKGSSMPDVSKYFKWYPVRAGDFLGDMIAGHNVFIQDIPKKFDQAHAKHFALVESVAIVPVFALSMVHYFSVFTQYPARADLLPKLQSEMHEKTNAIRFWLDTFAKRQALDSVAWRYGMLMVQVTTFPLWLLLASASPAIVHCTMHRVNHIMAAKYSCISASAPALVMTHGRATEASEEFHRTLTHTPTDFGAAIVLLVVLWYLTL